MPLFCRLFHGHLQSQSHQGQYGVKPLHAQATAPAHSATAASSCSGGETRSVQICKTKLVSDRAKELYLPVPEEIDLSLRVHILNIRWQSALGWQSTKCAISALLHHKLTQPDSGL